MPWPGVEAGIAKPVQQGVDPREAVTDAEFGLKDQPNLLGPERADAVLGLGAGVDPLPEAFGVVLGQVPGLAGAWAVAQSVGALVVITCDPTLDRTAGAAQGRGDLGSSPPLRRKEDDAKPDEDAFVRLGVGPVAKLVECQMVDDMHGRASEEFPAILPPAASGRKGA